MLVNPYHVKCSKELDDNIQTKTDQKDPKTIAGLVRDGRFWSRTFRKAFTQIYESYATTDTDC